MTRNPRMGVVPTLVLIGITAPGMTVAHAILVKSIPAENAALSAPPEEIEVWFNEGVGEEYKALAVIDGQGARVDDEDARLGFFDSSYLRVSVPPLQPGVYTVRYRVQSADGHIVSGKFNFSVAGTLDFHISNAVQNHFSKVWKSLPSGRRIG